MSTATFSPSAPQTGTAPGSDNHTPHGAAGAMRAVKVFVGTLFSVAVLGEYGRDAGVVRR
ncbi:hypothetical protein ABT354_12670 [Streptomyces sp. NPDC000594]|uniref:hypothetical protein n=1 Tax=Streptomyces sp. NPDC000594 TaxID=3154261 RepID=UPI0033322227